MADYDAYAQKVRADFERVAANLVDLDGDPATKLLQAGGLAGGTAERAKAAQAALARMWTVLPALRAQLDAADEERSKGRKADEAVLEKLLAGPSVVIDTTAVPAAQRSALGTATHTTSLTVAQAMDQLITDYTTAADTIHAIGAAWREGLGQIDQARVALTGIDPALGPLPQADHARRLLDRASAVAATDPLGLTNELGGLGTAIDAACAAAAEVARRRDGLLDDIEVARGQLRRIDDLVRRGANGLDAARAKIANPAGLLAPLDPAEVLDAPGRGLGPWLARIAASAAAEWRAAVNGLDAWRRVADGTETAARQIAEANEAPVTERNELRGLLGGLAAKAAARGHAEHPELAAAHRAARELLWSAPCDLAASRRAVDAFTAALDRITRPSGAA
jgi:hypothetical protein